jgi:uncharacterized integral membrane protein (TIGR02327 family)
MNIKLILYILIVPLSMWTITSLNLERYFKKGSINQIRIFYVMLSLALSYLIVNFLYDFYEVSQIIK